MILKEGFVSAAEIKENGCGRVVMHLDLDAFFAACEIVRNKSLRGKPVIIGADPKEGKGRGVVSTASYEARKYGIGSAMPISWAYRKCKQGVFLPADIKYYSAVSERVMELIKSFIGKRAFEQVSVDEVYVNLSDLGFAKSRKLALNINKEIFRKEGITCSIGIGPNKLIAKIASDFRKPRGLTIVKEHEVLMFLNQLNVSVIPGIGPKMQIKLGRIGIKNVKDLRKFGEEELIKKFGERMGAWLNRKSLGESLSEVGEFRKRKSIGAERTFFEDEENKDIVLKKLDKLIDKIWLQARNKKFSFRTVVIKLRFENFETHTRQKSFEYVLKRKSEIRETVVDLLEEYFTKIKKEKRKIRLIGLRFSGSPG